MVANGGGRHLLRPKGYAVDRKEEEKEEEEEEVKEKKEKN